MKHADHLSHCQSSPKVRYGRRDAETALPCSFPSHLLFTGEAANDNRSTLMARGGLDYLTRRLLPLVMRQTWSERHRLLIRGLLAALFAGAVVCLYAALAERIQLLRDVTAVLIGKS